LLHDHHRHVHRKSVRMLKVSCLSANFSGEQST
jgi:hypothetical protein